MNDDSIRKPEPDTPHTDSSAPENTPPTPGTSLLRQIARTALLSLVTTPAPILTAIVDWWLKTH
ncbi:hypothetical protein [Kitasatospora cineracea]|uniref:hypothetical protein n=1 Tax=Kitasatospora cineracea TaxID=88074 RepID=UPI0033F3B76E